MEISDEDMTRRKGKILNIFDIYWKHSNMQST